MSRKYFGIDGVCGWVGQLLIILDFVMCFGYVVGKVLLSQSEMFFGECFEVLIGKDMWFFGYMLELVFEVGFLVVGVDVCLVGFLFILVVVYLIWVLCLQVGIVILVFYNFYYDNGIKFFLVQGMKLLDDVECVIEEGVDQFMVCVLVVDLGWVK